MTGVDRAAVRHARVRALLAPVLRAVANGSPAQLRVAEMALLDYLDGQCALRVAITYEMEYGRTPKPAHDEAAA